jgi:protocatechuate 3,4-dioxygenase beta subunit
VSTPGAALTHHTGGASIGGTVSDGDGNPMCDVAVWAFRSDDGWVGTLDTTTGCDGDYRLEGLEPGEYQLVAFAPEGSGLQNTWYGGTSHRASATPVTVTAGETAPAVDLVLAAGGSIRGAVTDEGGLPVAGATVWAFRADDTWIGSAASTTNDDGTYVFDGLAAQEHRLLVVPPAGSGLRSAWVGGSSRADATPLMVTHDDPVIGADVTLAAAGAITGTVTGPGGAPVAGATVWAYAPDDGWVGSAVASSDGSGRYSLAGLRLGPVRLLVVPPGPGLQPAWYLDSSSRATATPVVVVAGPPVVIDVALHP